MRRGRDGGQGQRIAGTSRIILISPAKPTLPVFSLQVHALSAGLKAYVTHYTANALSVCRESTGGHGYAAVNRLGAMRR